MRPRCRRRRPGRGAPREQGSCRAAPRCARGLDDGLDLSGRPLRVIVHHLMIVSVLERELGDRTLLAGPEARRVLGGALDETLFECLDTRGQQVDVRPAVADARADLLGTLDV